MSKSPNKKELTAAQRTELLKTLQVRFEKHRKRHEGIEWMRVWARLVAHPQKLWTLQRMEATGGEPDLVGQDAKTGEFVFYDFSPESPKGRTSLCYDGEALETRKEHKPENSALDMAATMGIELLTEEEYRALQRLGIFDAKTSSWVKTPAEMRELGGALFGDRRFGRVFLYHNGAQSYYGSRGFRGSVRV